MQYLRFESSSQDATVSMSRFVGSSGVDECHCIVRVLRYGGIEEQLASVRRAYEEALGSAGLSQDTAVFRRFFCSDLVNQASVLRGQAFSNPGDPAERCAISWVGQPPLVPGKVALWAYHVSDRQGGLEKVREGANLILRRGELSHHFTTGLTCTKVEGSHQQTNGIFEAYDGMIGRHGMSLLDNVVRTWLFVRSVDVNYGGMVNARRELFAAHGLTPETHFIASSGIEGVPEDIAANVVMDSYAIGGLRAQQVRYLSALDHLGPTYTYGVTFERGTSVGYRDRKHVLLSGTASIDSEGNILHAGDVSRQLERTLENMAALLANAGTTLADMCVFIVYVRDQADQLLAEQLMQQRFPSAPMVVVVAPVCRPGWLIELEGVAIVPASDSTLPAF